LTNIDAMRLHSAASTGVNTKDGVHDGNESSRRVT
jgi:hypothetical protein